MKLCTCNNCGKVYEDMNPQANSKDYPNISVESLRTFYVETTKPETAYWGCPECCTDAYLQDDINWKSLSRLDALILNKKLGNDCAENDSAFIKGWLRDTTIMLESDDIPHLNDIQLLFPLEYGEWAEEDENSRT